MWQYSCVVAVLFRNHLFVWSVFSPKLLYELVFSGLDSTNLKKNSFLKKIFQFFCFDCLLNCSQHKNEKGKRKRNLSGKRIKHEEDVTVRAPYPLNFPDVPPYMYVCMYVCIYVYVICMYVCMYINMYVCMYIHTYIHTYIHAWAYISKRISVYVCI